MKKLITLILALALMLSLAACGVKDKLQNAVKDAISGDTDSGKSSSSGKGDSGASGSTKSGGDSGDVGYKGGGEYKGHTILSDYASNSAAPDMLHRFGLTDDVIFPPEAMGITRYLEDPYDDAFVRTEYGFEVPDEPTKDEFKEYSRTIYEALLKLSDDGKLYLWYSGDWETTDDDGYMIIESFGDVIAGALFATWHSYDMKYDGRAWSVSVSTEESSAPYSHWEFQVDITTAFVDDLTPVVEGEHTPEPEPFVDSHVAEADVIGKTTQGERLVIKDNITEPGKDYNFYAERCYIVYVFAADGEEIGFYNYYFYDDEATFDKGLEKNLADDLWEEPPYIASRMSLYICEGGKPFFTHFDSYQEAYDDFKTRGDFYEIVG
jgi:predicted small lipoprotein YifL